MEKQELDIATLTVVIVEDDPRTLAHLQECMSSDPRFRVVAGVETLAQGLGAVKQHRPQVLLVDLGLPDGSGLDIVRAAAQDPATHILVLSAFGDERNVLDAVEAGAGGYLLKDGKPAEIVDSVLRLVAGEAPISPSIAVHLLRRLRPRPVPAADRVTHPCDTLTDRELSVLQLVAKGLSYEEIGAAMELRYNTIASYIKGIYRKLSVRSRGEAVFEARQMGLLE